MLLMPAATSNPICPVVGFGPRPVAAITGRQTAKPTSMTPPSIGQAPISFAPLDDDMTEAAQQRAASAPPRIASTAESLAWALGLAGPDLARGQLGRSEPDPLLPCTVAPEAHSAPRRRRRHLPNQRSQLGNEAPRLDRRTYAVSPQARPHGRPPRNHQHAAQECRQDVRGPRVPHRRQP